MAFIAELIRSSQYIQITKKRVTFDNLPKSFNGTKILQISDLHGQRFGLKNTRLIKKIKQQNADYIVFTGDMLDCNRNENGAFFELTDALKDDCPLFFSMGNHETRLKNMGKCKDFDQTLKKYGVCVLDNKQIKISKNNEYIYISGYTQLLNWNGDQETVGRATFGRIESKDIETLIQKKDTFEILLAHDPAQFEAYCEWGADMIFSGHVHGGMWRIFGIGLLSPAVKLFPKYHSGVYEHGMHKMFVSRGMCFSHIPRIFNPPEIAVITLKKE